MQARLRRQEIREAADADEAFGLNAEKQLNDVLASATLQKGRTRRRVDTLKQHQHTKRVQPSAVSSSSSASSAGAAAAAASSSSLSLNAKSIQRLKSHAAKEREMIMEEVHHHDDHQLSRCVCL